MAEHACKNYMTDGGDTLVIGGNLTVEAGATVTGLEAGPAYVLPAATDDTLGGVKVGDGLSIDNGVLSVDMEPAANQEESEAAELADLVSDFNDLLAALKAAGLMVADSEG